MSDFIVTLVFFASMEVVSKPLMGSIDPLTLTFWRFAGGASVLTGYMLAKRGLGTLRTLAPGTVLLLALMGVVNIAIAMSLLQTGVKHTSAAKAATVFCSSPVLVFAFSVITGAEKYSLRRVLGLAAGLAGLALVSGLHTFTVDKGTFYALLSAAAFALYTVLGRKASQLTDAVTINTVSFAAGLAALLPVILLTGRRLSPEPLAADTGTMAVTAYLALGVSGLAYITFIRAIGAMGAVAASMVFMLKPAVAALLAMILLKDSHPTVFWAGLALTSLGSYLVIGKRRVSR